MFYCKFVALELAALACLLHYQQYTTIALWIYTLAIICGAVALVAISNAKRDFSQDFNDLVLIVAYPLGVTFAGQLAYFSAFVALYGLIILPNLYKQQKELKSRADRAPRK